MKKVLAILKARWPVIVCVVVAVAALPTLLLLGSGKHAKLKSQVQSELDSADRTLQQVSYRYEFAPLTPGDEPVSVQRAPNAAMNAELRRWFEHIQSEASAAVQAVVDHNSAGKKPMLDGLFPEPEPAQRVAKLQEAARVWPQRHAELLAAVRAGGPPDAGALFETLRDMWLKKVELIVATRGAEGVTDEEVARIRDDLTAARLTAVRDRAAELRFYADPGVFTSVVPWTATALPTMALVWDWQWRLWIHQDIMAALDRANADPDSSQLRLSLLEGPVKRVQRVQVDAWNLLGVRTAPVGTDITAEIPRNYQHSLTGRAAFPAANNPLYDLRYAEVELLVDSARLPVVLGAIASTNLMAVTDVRIEDINPAEHLAQGFVYGDGHIVRAVIQVETAWIRSWMAALAPPEVRVSLGIEQGAESEEGEEGGRARERRPSSNQGRGGGDR